MSLTFQDLLELVQEAGHPLTVEFVKAKDGRNGSVEDLESYAEPGMRANLTGGYSMADDVVVLEVDYAPFETFNLPFETHSYYDKQRQPTLSAREAGFYKAQDNLYFGGSAPIESVLKVLGGPELALREAWKAQDNGETYVAWLEKRVLALDPSIANTVAAKPDTTEDASPTPSRRTGPRC